MKIGIVGGGASAVCLLDMLAQRTELRGGRVTVFEPSARPWRGRAYQPDMEAVRVNTPPQDMSIRADSDEHFLEWLEVNEFVDGAGGPYWDSRAQAAFVPRALYGEYLECSARAAWTALLRRGWQVELVRDHVRGTVATPEGLVLVTADGTRRVVDHAVLCVGAGGPADLYALAGTDRYVQAPYPLAGVTDDIPRDASVAVIGSGLTAVDVVRGLTSAGHRGRISLLSRRGVLPGVRQPVVHHRLRHFTPARFRAAWSRGESLSLAELTAVMVDELVDAGESPAALYREITAVYAEAPVDRLRRQLAATGSRRRGLRILQQAVPEVGPDVWPLLTDAEQDDLLTRHDRTIMSLCCPMSPGSAVELLDLAGRGQLTVVPGLREVSRRRDGRFTVHTAEGRRSADVADVVDVVVNAVNLRRGGFSAMARPLVGSLVTAGLAEPHPRGGLRVERATSRLVVRGEARHELYALGDPAAGSLFFTFGIQSIVDRARDIVDAIRTHHSPHTGALPVRYPAGLLRTA